MPDNRAEHGEYARPGGRHRHCIHADGRVWHEKMDVGTNIGTLPRCYDDGWQ
jgi:hypothetical protein